MKTFLLLTIFSCLSLSLNAQQSDSNRARAEKEQQFAKNLKLTSSCFANQEIPKDFPLPSAYRDEKTYREAAYAYVRNNPEKFVKEELEKNGLWILGFPESKSGSQPENRVKPTFTEEELQLMEQKKQAKDN
jgi:hypothetical protein